MIVSELIEALARVENQMAEVKVKHGWEHTAPLHYTRRLAVNGLGEPVIFTSWAVDDPDADGPEPVNVEIG